MCIENKALGTISSENLGEIFSTVVELSVSGVHWLVNLICKFFPSFKAEQILQSSN